MYRLIVSFNEGIKAVNTTGTAEIDACGVMNLEVGDSAQEIVGLRTNSSSPINNH